MPLFFVVILVNLIVVSGFAAVLLAIGLICNHLPTRYDSV
jgi:hypothetical protein